MYGLIYKFFDRLRFKARTVAARAESVCGKATSSNKRPKPSLITEQEKATSPGQGAEFIYKSHGANGDVQCISVVEIWPEAKQLLIHSIDVPAEYRRQGIATAMLVWLQEKYRMELIPIHIKIPGREFWNHIYSQKYFPIGRELRSAEYQNLLELRKNRQDKNKVTGQCLSAETVLAELDELLNIAEKREHKDH